MGCPALKKQDFDYCDYHHHFNINILIIFGWTYYKESLFCICVILVRSLAVSKSHFNSFPHNFQVVQQACFVLQVKVVTDAGLASHLDPTLLQPADGDTSALGLGQSPSPISLQGSAPPRDQDRFVWTVSFYILSLHTKR